VLKFAYHTFSVQIALPVIVLAFSNRTNDVKRYLIGFAIALTVTIVVSALLPAASPLAFADQSTFHLLRFTGATPVDDLMRLRSSEPVIIDGGLGGIISFPSFHATVATLTPLTLRRYRVLFLALLILDAAMLCSAITEGAHYVSDIPAGCGVAFVAFFLAGRLVGTKNADHHLVTSRSDLHCIAP
jgi:membrane-associated phospholipid phosphatase